MRKDLKRRIGKLETKMGLTLKTDIRVINFVDKQTMDKEPNVYSTEVHVPMVRQQPDEKDDAFYERAKKELLGESANKPGLHLLFSWYLDPETPLGPLEK